MIQSVLNMFYVSLLHANKVSEGYVFAGVCLSTVGLCPGGSLSRISVQGDLCPGGLCPYKGRVSLSRGLCTGCSLSGEGSLSRGSLSRGLCPVGSQSRGSLCPEDLCQRGLCLGVLCPGCLHPEWRSLSMGPLSKESLSRGSLSMGFLPIGSLSREVSVQVLPGTSGSCSFFTNVR